MVSKRKLILFDVLNLSFYLMALFISQHARRTFIRDRTFNESLFSSESLKCKFSNFGEKTPKEFVQFENCSVNTHFAKYQE